MFVTMIPDGQKVRTRSLFHLRFTNAVTSCWLNVMPVDAPASFHTGHRMENGTRRRLARMCKWHVSASVVNELFLYVSPSVTMSLGPSEFS